MMAGLMMVFLFIAVLFMHEIQKDQRAIKEIAEDYNNIREQLNKDLNNEFKDDLVKWKAEILKDNTIRFKSPDILFDISSAQIKPLFKEVINDFFPRYLGILTNKKYKDQIDEVRIEGHTSSFWNAYVTKNQSYIKNMELSQARARSVLEYSYAITIKNSNKEWLRKVLRANGMSFAKLIKINEKEDTVASQRVEFRVLTKAEEKIYEIIDKLQ